jgi:hypothetical protein
MFTTLNAELARELILDARRVAERYRLAEGLLRLAAGAGRSKWRRWRTNATPVPRPESAASTVA